MLDTILKNGQIFDGSGKKPINSDIGIKDNIISEIGNIDSDKGKEVIDVDGLAVSPGFVKTELTKKRTLSRCKEVISKYLNNPTNIIYA